MKYRCNICNVFEYDDTIGDSQRGIKSGTKSQDFADGWRCPICSSDKTQLLPLQPDARGVTVEQTVKCPVGAATQDPELRYRLRTRISEKMLANYLAASTREPEDFARLIGNADMHGLSVSDLRTTNSEISTAFLLSGFNSIDFA